MSPRTSGTDYSKEPRQRFYPNQGMIPGNRPQIPSAPTPYKKGDDASYLMHRHPVLLQRLYNTADILLDSYPKQSFLYDAYPDYLSLRLMRDRLLRENRELTESFLQSGCPVVWLELLTDTVLSDLLCKKRCLYRNPMGEASTTSVQSASLS